jgi:hypothetical protein
MITVIRRVTFEIPIGTFIGGLMVAEAGQTVAVVVVVVVAMVDWDVLSKHMLATRHLMMEPVHLSPTMEDMVAQLTALQARFSGSSSGVKGHHSFPFSLLSPVIKSVNVLRGLTTKINVTKPELLIQEPLNILP